VILIVTVDYAYGTDLSDSEHRSELVSGLGFIRKVSWQEKTGHSQHTK